MTTERPWCCASLPGPSGGCGESPIADVSHMIRRLPDGSGGWVRYIACRPGHQIRRLEWRKDPVSWFWEDFGFGFSLACPTCLRLAGDSGDHAYYRHVWVTRHEPAHREPAWGPQQPRRPAGSSSTAVLRRRWMCRGCAAIAAGENPRNIGCLSHLRGRTPVPVRHWIELCGPAA